MFGVPLRRRQISPQLLRIAPRAVARRITLNAPPLRERSGVNGVEPERIEELGNDRFRRGIVPSDHQGAPVLRSMMMGAYDFYWFRLRWL